MYLQDTPSLPFDDPYALQGQYLDLNALQCFEMDHLTVPSENSIPLLNLEVFDQFDYEASPAADGFVDSQDSSSTSSSSFSSPNDYSSEVSAQMYASLGAPSPVEASLPALPLSVIALNHHRDGIDLNAALKREKRRERNRIAARNCRNRKLDQINTFELQKKTLLVEIAQIEAEVEQLKQRKIKIRTMMLQYLWEKRGFTKASYY